MISCVINLDTRDGFDGLETTAEGLFSGCKSVDFLVDGIKNKKKFLEGFDHEIIAFIDIHNKVPDDVLKELNRLCDTLVLRKHTDGHLFNDRNYLSALRLASGDYIMHFDQDCAAFSRGKEGVEKLISYLDEWKYVSYPSALSPNAVHDPSFNYKWCSTRFFVCKKETINFEEMERCFDYDYFCDTYKPSRICHWLEHWIGLEAKSSVIYPPPSDLYTIFCWGNYRTGILKQLNEMTFEQVNDFVNANYGIHYPCDLTLK